MDTLVAVGMTRLVTLGRSKPRFERGRPGPLVRGVGRTSGDEVLQAGSRHASPACVIVVRVIVLMWLGGTT